MKPLSGPGWGGLPAPRRSVWLLFLTALAFSAALRVHAALRPGLWVDEVFSVAVATGHSLEHPPAVADPARGDYVEPVDGRPAAAWRDYLRHDAPPAGPARVVRAVFLSDTNPPLYYLLLSGWMRLAGTGDAPLRLFSVLAALACLPLLWHVGRMLGGRRVAAVACLLFAFAPTSLYYSAEGRMYSLTWLLGLLLAWIGLEIRRRGARPGWLAAWALVGAAALLTHYFLAFVWAACALWLLLVPGRATRPAAAAAAALSLALVLPWYLRVPESLAQWRVTAGWLDAPLAPHEALLAPLILLWGMFTPGGEAWDPGRIATWLVVAALVPALVAALRRGAAPLFTPRRLLPWLWLAASVSGVLVFDLLRGTHAALYPRYAVMGLPAAFLLVGLLVARLPRTAAAAALLLLLAGWMQGIRGTVTGSPRPWQPFFRIAANLDAGTTAEDLVIVRSIPSGVLGVARYLEGDTPVASWVEQLGTRGEEEIERVTAGRCQIALVSTHTMTDVDTAEPWLRANARLIGEEGVRDVRLLYFRRHPPAGLPAEACPHLGE
jgi:hypothetical protein